MTAAFATWRAWARRRRGLAAVEVELRRRTRLRVRLFVYTFWAVSRISRVCSRFAVGAAFVVVWWCLPASGA